jgi:cell division protein FtsA
MRKIMASLDVGSSSIKLIVGEIIKEKLNILAVSEVKTQGFKKSIINNEEKFIIALKQAFSDIEAKIGIPVTKVIVNVPETDAEFTIGESTIKIENEGNVIKGSDIAKVIRESSSGVVQDNMELITVMPTVFKLANNEYVKDPKNNISSSLSVKSVIIMAPKASIYPILIALEKLNIDVIDISFSTIGDYYTFNNSNLDKLIGAVVNIGYEKTTIGIFNKGVLTNTTTINLGGLNIDNDLSYIYKIDTDLAKKVKEELALATIKLASLKDEMEVVDLSGNKLKLNQYDVSNVVNSRLTEILGLVKKEINHLTKKNLSYIIFTGGTTEINDFNLCLESIFGKSAIIGKISNLGVRNNKYSSALGLIKWYNNMQKLKNKDYSIFDIDEQERLSGVQHTSLSNDNSVIGKVFGYFFDN